MSRQWTEVETAWIGLGSNLGDSAAILRQAVRDIDGHQSCRIEVVSSCYRSRALGPGRQPDYLNAVLRLRTMLGARQLLALLHEIETAHGRQREQHWGPRTLDLDLLLFDTQTIDEPGLRVPHPRMEERNFVVCPLAELDPQLALPSGLRASRLCRNLGTDGLERLADFRF